MLKNAQQYFASNHKPPGKIVESTHYPTDDDFLSIITYYSNCLCFDSLLNPLSPSSASGPKQTQDGASFPASRFGLDNAGLFQRILGYRYP